MLEENLAHQLPADDPVAGREEVPCPRSHQGGNSRCDPVHSILGNIFNVAFSAGARLLHPVAKDWLSVLH